MNPKSKSHSFHVQKRSVVFSKGPIHLVDCLVKMPSGRTLSRQIIEHPGAVVIIPRLTKTNFILIRQFRFAARKWLWEWPAGGVELGESLRRSASRELMEETGYFPKKLTRLISFYPTPGISSEVMHLFLGEHLIPRTAVGDEDEAIECHEFSLSKIERMIKSGEINDAKTILGFHLLKKFK